MYNTVALKKDVDVKPIPQFFNPVTDSYEVLQGRNGANRVEIVGPDGNPLSILSGKLTVRASELEAILGEVTTTPTANTLLARLKTIESYLDQLEGYTDGIEAGIGAQADAEAAGNGSTIAILKRLRTLLNGGLPAALTAGGGVKAGIVDALPAGTNTIGGIKVVGNDTMLQGNINLSGAAQQVAANTACKNVTIQAHPANVGYVMIGKADVSSTVYMYILTPGSSITIYPSNLNLVYVFGTAGDKVSYGGEV